MGDEVTRDNVILLIVSIVLAALIVRVIYAIAEVLGIYAEEVYDEDYRDGYTRTTNILASAILVSGISIFLFIVVYWIWLKYETK